MRLIIGNVQTRTVIGGKDNLLPFNLQEKLREYLRVRPEGYWHSPAYKMQKWDGYRYFITTRGTFATGFLPMVMRYLTDIGVEVIIQDERGELPYLNEELDTQLGEWSMTGKFEFQAKLTNKIKNYLTLPDGSKLYFPRGIIDAATNAGKTSIMAGIFKNIIGHKQAIFTIHSKDIYDQALEYFSTLFEVGEIRSGKYEIKPFTIAMVKTLHNRMKESVNVLNDLQKFNVLFVDEAHLCGSDEYSKVLMNINAPMRVLVSGTPLDNDSDVANMIIIGTSGKVLGKITNKELFDLGVSLRPTVNVLLNKTRASRLLPSYEQEMEKFIYKSAERAHLIYEAIMQRKDKFIVIAFEDIAHGYFMMDYLTKQSDFNLSCDIVHGEDKDRKQKLKDFKAGKIQVLFGSTILQAGLNLHNIQVMIYAMGGKSKISVKQFAIGRTIRDDKVSENVEIIDFWDVGKWISEHSRIRLKHYRKEEIEVVEHYDIKEVRKMTNYD